jgi:cytochrome c-type biogenesis protein CcsB
MKKVFPWLVFLAACAFVTQGLWMPPPKGAYDLRAFGKIPVLLHGRIKPLDTVARTSLLSFQDRQRVKLPEGSEISPIEWLLDVAFKPEQADTYPTFKIDNPELLTLIGKTDDSLRIHYQSTAYRVLAVFDFVPSRYRRFSYSEISPALAELERQAQLAQAVDNQQRNPFQRATLALYSNLLAYQQLKYSLVQPESPDFLGELRELQAGLPKGIEAVRAKKAGEPHDEAAAQQMIEAVRQFDSMTRFGSLFAVPPDPTAPTQEWRKVGQALLDTFRTGELNPTATAFAAMGYAWRNDRPASFNEAVSRYRDRLDASIASSLKKTDTETLFNRAEPFYQSMQLFAVAFLIGVFSWLRWPELMGRSAFFLVLATFVAATIGILVRMWLEGRPPVTNLYSSALFVGWVAVGLCLVLEVVYKNCVGTVAGAAIGFCAFLIAHHLSFGGDTLEMMRAVLDDNFWLGTHVVVVTMGYASTFLAGFLGITYILMGVFTNWLPKQFDRRAAARSVPAGKKGETNDQAITRMTYGIICFATLFSLIGTILGGIWADQSWGRFWGWDPKENGALIIVVWNALILHARWGGMVKSRGLACLAVFGNVVTSWSWFGTNMLGIGLHSYGFMEQAFKWLIAFVVLQVAIIALGALVPTEHWRSFRGRTPPPRDPKLGKSVPQVL